MVKNGKIPVIVGVTGHRDLREQDIAKLKESVRCELESLRKGCPHSRIVVMTSLAAGADQLCAEVALEMGLEIITVLPMETGEYEKDFSGADAEKLHALMEKSSKVFVAPHSEPFRDSRDYLYRQAGIYVAEHCHVLMALWDGAAATPGGCGTASIVEYKRGNLSREAGEQLRHRGGYVVQIVTPKAGPEASSDNGGADIIKVDESITETEAGTVIMHGDAASLKRIFRDTDIYNADCEKAKEEGSSDLLSAVYVFSDRMSVINAVKYRRLLAGMSVCAVILAMAFLLYDEIDWQGMILLCGIMIILLFAVNYISGKSKYRERYLEYRILAEACRVQSYLRTAGTAYEVADFMPWNLQVAVPWISKAMSAIGIGHTAGSKQSILRIWIMDQKEYHKNALTRCETQLRRNDRIVRTALIFTLFIYLAALAFEIICCGLFGGSVMFSPAINDIVRVVIKVAMGTFSAATVFTGNYYGKQALPNVIDDHLKMILLYEEAEHEIAEKGESELLLARIAEDELGENANWYAYQSKHEPELGI